jgi:hypothetical protein
LWNDRSAPNDARAEWVLVIVLQAQPRCASLPLDAPPPYGLSAESRQQRRATQQVVRGRAQIVLFHVDAHLLQEQTCVLVKEEA